MFDCDLEFRVYDLTFRINYLRLRLLKGHLPSFRIGFTSLVDSPRRSPLPERCWQGNKLLKGSHLIIFEQSESFEKPIERGTFSTGFPFASDQGPNVSKGRSFDAE